jgi:hypothetical protein
MTSERDTNGHVRDWMRDGDFPLPDRVLDAALEDVSTTPQRRGAIWRLGALRLPNNLAAVAAAILVVAILGATFMAGRFIGTPQSTTPPAPALLPAVDGPVPGGTYRIDAPFPIEATIEVPDTGWSSFGVSHEIASVYRGADFDLGVGLWIVGNLPVDGCQLELGEMDPSVGPTVEDLAGALAARPDVTFGPVDVTLDGYSGQYVEITGQGIPGGGCFDRTQWTVDGPTGPVTRGSLYLERDLIWILDVNGTRVVVDAFWQDAVSEQDEAEARRIVESLDLEPETAP